MSKAELERFLASQTEDERDDYIQERLFGKALAAFAEDHGRLIVLQSAKGARVHVICANEDDPDATTDGTTHLVQVHAMPGLMARLRHDKDLTDFANHVIAGVEALLSTHADITLLRKDT